MQQLERDYDRNEEVIYNFNKEFYFDLLVFKMYKLMFNKIFLIVLFFFYCIALIIFSLSLILQTRESFKFLIPFFIDGLAFFLKVYYTQVVEENIYNNTICIKLAKVALIVGFPLITLNLVVTPIANILFWKALPPGILPILVTMFEGLLYSMTYFDLSLYLLLLLNTTQNISKKKINQFNYDNTFFFYTNLVEILLFIVISFYYYYVEGYYVQIVSTIIYILILLLLHYGMLYIFP